MQISRIRLSVWKFVFIAPVPRTFSVSFHFGHDGIVQLGQAVCGSPHHLRIAPFDSPFGQYISYPHVLCLPFSRRGPSLHGHCPASPLLRPHPTTAFASATRSSPKFPCRTFGTRSAFGYPQMNTFSADMPPLPRRAHLAQIESARRCWFHEHRSADHAETFNETLCRKFTCVTARLFVRQDSRTSVALCTACRPNRMSISLRYSSFRY